LEISMHIALFETIIGGFRADSLELNPTKQSNHVTGSKFRSPFRSLSLASGQSLYGDEMTASHAFDMTNNKQFFLAK